MYTAFVSYIVYMCKHIRHKGPHVPHLPSRLLPSPQVLGRLWLIYPATFPEIVAGLEAAEAAGGGEGGPGGEAAARRASGLGDAGARVGVAAGLCDEP